MALLTRDEESLGGGYGRCEVVDSLGLYISSFTTRLLIYIRRSKAFDVNVDLLDDPVHSFHRWHN